MRVSCSLISSLIWLAGQSHSAPIRGLGLGNNYEILGGTPTSKALPVKGGLNDSLLGGLLGDSKSGGVLGGSESGKLLTVTGYNGGDSLISTNGLLGAASLKKRLSLPLIGDLGSFDGFKTKVELMAAGVGSKLSGLLRKRDIAPALTSTLSHVPIIGYMPGFGTLPAASTLPGISSLPGINFFSGLGTSPSSSNPISSLEGPVPAASPSTTATVLSPTDKSSAALSGIFSKLPGAMESAI